MQFAHQILFRIDTIQLMKMEIYVQNLMIEMFDEKTVKNNCSICKVWNEIHSFIRDFDSSHVVLHTVCHTQTRQHTWKRQRPTPIRSNLSSLLSDCFHRFALQFANCCVVLWNVSQSGVWFDCDWCVICLKEKNIILFSVYINYY